MILDKNASMLTTTSALILIKKANTIQQIQCTWLDTMQSILNAKLVCIISNPCIVTFILISTNQLYDDCITVKFDASNSYT